MLAAHAVLAAGVKRVLILDLDAHGGGGTHDTRRPPAVAGATLKALGTATHEEFEPPGEHPPNSGF